MPDPGADARRRPAHPSGKAQATAESEIDEPAAQPTYVQVARGMRWSGRSLTLIDLAPGTIYVSPSTGLLGVLSTGEFLDAWSRIRPGGQAASTLAVVSLMDACRTLLGDAELLVSEPTICGDGLRYTAELISGILPGRSGASVLFIGAAAASIRSHGGRPTRNDPHPARTTP